MSAETISNGGPPYKTFIGSIRHQLTCIETALAADSVHEDVAVEAEKKLKAVDEECEAILNLIFEQ